METSDLRVKEGALLKNYITQREEEGGVLRHFARVLRVGYKSVT
jgi:hypothetical protein